MLKNNTVAVVVPAYNEERQIGRVLESMPDFVDFIIVVNDKSTDSTSEIVKSYMLGEGANKIINAGNENVKTKSGKSSRISIKEELLLKNTEIITGNAKDKRKIILINMQKNMGVGAAIARGYKWCKDHKIDCTAVMAGDGQMNPAELKNICYPIIEEGIDYVKGNRLYHRSSLLVIPKLRYFGNSILSILTKIASGYWHVSDTQSGYTAISYSALQSIRLHKIYKGYGMPNDMLVKLNIAFCTLKEIPIKPVYDIGENSKMKVWKVVPKISWLLLKSFFIRIWKKYLFRDFHPLFLLYHLAIIMGLCSIPFAVDIVEKVFTVGSKIVSNNLIVFVFLFISSFQSLIFAMWMDIQDNERLYK